MPNEEMPPAFLKNGSLGKYNEKSNSKGGNTNENNNIININSFFYCQPIQIVTATEAV